MNSRKFAWISDLPRHRSINCYISSTFSMQFSDLLVNIGGHTRYVKNQPRPGFGKICKSRNGLQLSNHHHDNYSIMVFFIC